MSDECLTTGAHPVARWGRNRPDATAVVEHGIPYSYATLARNIAQAARILASAGIVRGMLVGIECEVRYLHLTLILACEVLGAAHVALVTSDLTSESDLLPRCDMLCVQSDAAGISARSRIIQLTPAFAAELSRIPVNGDELQRLGRGWPGGDLVRVGRTSGTTGGQKYVGFARRALGNFAAFLPSTLKSDQATFNYVSLYSFTSMATYNNCRLALRLGSTVIFSTGDSFPADIRGLPSCHTALLVRDAAAFLKTDRGGRVDTCSISVIGGFVSPALRAALRESVTAAVLHTYSMNEVGRVTSNDDDGPGVVLPGVSIRIVDEIGRQCEPGQPGRILIRTPWMADGYLWDATLNARHFAGGWFHTSDIGIAPEPARLIVLGRADEMLILGGIKLAPGPIEERIKAMDGVNDAALISVDNAIGPGDLHIFIERNDPAADGALEARITPLLIGYVTSYQLHYLSRLPRTDTGKIQRGMLKQSLSASTSPR